MESGLLQAMQPGVLTTGCAVGLAAQLPCSFQPHAATTASLPGASRFTRHSVWSDPHTTSRTLPPTSTLRGEASAALSVVWPPNWPKLVRPHMYKAPDRVMAAMWFHPDRMPTTGSSAAAVLSTQ